MLAVFIPLTCDYHGRGVTRYVLRQPTRGFIVNVKEDKCTGVVLDGKAIRAKHVITSLQCLPESMVLPSTTTSPAAGSADGTAVADGGGVEAGAEAVADVPHGFVRACLITDGSILGGSTDPVSITTVPPGAAGNPTAAKVICLSSAVAVCPAGTFMCDNARWSA